MNNEQDSHDVPNSDAHEPRLASEPMPFRAAVFRGIGAANKTLVGAVLVFAIIGPMQIASSLSGGLLMQGGAFQPPAEGEPPPPELFLMMGLGCFTCVWFLVLIFAMPWAGGGIYGQINDRVTGKPAGSFGQYGSRFYARILLLILIYLGVLFVLLIPLWVIGALVSAGQMQSGEFDPEKMRELGQHPANIAVGVFFGLALTAMGLVVTLAQATLVVDDCRTMEAISGAFRFIGRRFADVVKLFFVFVLTAIPIVVLQQAGNFLPTVTVPVMAVIGVLSAIYIGYLSVLNAGIGVSVLVTMREFRD